jgi:hypothetical protein
MLWRKIKQKRGNRVLGGQQGGKVFIYSVVREGLTEKMMSSSKT